MCAPVIGCTLVISINGFKAVFLVAIGKFLLARRLPSSLSIKFTQLENGEEFMAEPLLNKSQIQQLISSPSLIVRWIVLWLCSIVFLIGCVAGLILAANSADSLFLIIIAAPPVLASIYLAWMAWRPTAIFKRVGEICSALILVLSFPLSLLAFAPAGEGFTWNAAVFGFFGVGGVIFGVLLLCVVEITCIGVPGRAQGKPLKLSHKSVIDPKP